MARLATSDYEGVLAFLRAAGDVTETDVFSPHLLAELRRLIPCDIVSYGDFDPSCPGWRTRLRAAGDPRAPLTASLVTALRSLRVQNPFRPWDDRAGSAFRFSDLIAKRQLRKLDLYWEVLRPLGSEHMLWLWLVAPDGVVGGFAFDRLERDFSVRDREVLDTLAPHFLQLWLNGRRRRRSPLGLTHREHEIVSLVARGRTNREIAAALYVSPGTVRKHLDNVFTKLDVPNRAAAVARVFGSMPSP